jgi:hypothetical protein
MPAAGLFELHAATQEISPSTTKELEVRIDMPIVLHAELIRSTTKYAKTCAKLGQDAARAALPGCARARPSKKNHAARSNEAAKTTLDFPA